ncbi:MAG: hypothetical protein PHX08_07195 [Lachnospiraceae bacterium]|nr:hypothetical protein [Lachnospiraceae bacterium]
MKNKIKKRLIVAGGIVVIGILIVIIGTRFKKEPVTEAVISPKSSQSSEVVVDNPDESGTVEKSEKITVAPIDVTDDTSQGSGSVDTGTEQKIQGDIPEKPTYTKEQLKDPTQKPNGEKVETSKVKDKDKTPTVTPKPTKADNKIDKKPEENADKNSSGGLPGFNNVPDGGDNQVIDGKSDGDIDKQVGNMD